MSAKCEQCAKTRIEKRRMYGQCALDGTLINRTRQVCRMYVSKTNRRAARVEPSGEQVRLVVEDGE